MKISFNSNQLFDAVGKPLINGRVSFYLHDSDTLADVYTLEGNDFVQATNPVTLDNSGAFPSTIFMEASIYDVVVEQYVDGAYVQVYDMEYGFNMPSVKNDTVVEGIDGLADANPDVGFVTVVGYDGITYAGPRMYMWDAQCTDAADGGCIVESNNADSGRWLLLSDLREMPSTYYGVEAGRESNLSAFLTYPTTVGTHGIFMPPVPRFVKGVYQSEGTFTISKTLSFDKGAKFVKATFYCDSVEITAPVSDYVADFIFRRQSYAESEWFRTVHGFWACNAYELHQSANNHFADNALPQGQTAVQNARVSGRPMTMSGTGALLFNHCDIADDALSTEWYTAFYNMSISDRWFADTNWNIGQTTAYRQLAYQSNCTLDLVNFENPNVYLLFAAAWGLESINMLGRAGAYITADMPFVNVSNGSFEAIASDHAMNISNVQCNGLHLVDASFTLSNVVGRLATCSASSLTVAGGTLELLTDIDTTVTGLALRDMSIVMGGHKIAPTAGDWNFSHEVVIDGCDVTSGSIYSNAVYLHGSRLNNVVVNVYPFAIGGKWKLSMDVGENVFSGSSKVAIGADNGDGVQNQYVYDVEIQKLRITDNTFNTVESGVQCPFWGADGQHRYMRGIVATLGWYPDKAEWNAEVLYSGNKGNCPMSYGEPSANFNNIWHAIIFDEPGDSGDSKHIRFPAAYTPASVFCVPVTVDDGGTMDENNVWTISNKAKAVTPYKPRYMAYNSLELNATPFLFPYIMYTPECAWDPSMPNDMFTVRLGGSYNFTFNGAIPLPSAQ